MKMFKLTKLRVIVLLTVFSIFLGTAIGRTIAFFTASKESEGIFTLGNVYIEMTEAAVKYDAAGNLIEDLESPRVIAADTTDGGAPSIHDYGVVTPGQVIHKDPTITNIGDINAWMAAKVIIEDGTGDIHRLFKFNDYYDDIDIERFLSGGLLEERVHVDDWMGNESVCFNDNYAMVQIANRADNTYEFYFIMLNQFAPGESFEVFETLYINQHFGNNEMLELKDFKITVQAFATQTSGFESCYDAMTTAFPKHFSDIKN